MRLFAVSMLIAELATCCISGCGGGGIPRYEVSGKVTFNGTPVEKGEISFVPDKPGMAPDGGVIEKGEFRFAATEGKKTVQIRASRPIPGQRPGNSDMGPLYEDYIPAQFNRQSKLTAEVTAGGENEFTFDLKQ